MRFFLLLLLAIYSQLSHAIGLADLELKSHLGETLRAQLAVYDMPLNADPACFSVVDMTETSTPQKIQISLQANGDKAQLTLTSADLLFDPIISLRLSFACDPKLERDYTLLLDPAPYQEVSNKQPYIESGSTASYQATSVGAVSKKSVKIKPSNPGTNRAKLESSKSNPVNDKHWESSIDEKLLAAYTGKPSKELPSPSLASKAKVAKPAALVISAAAPLQSQAAAGLSLRLSKAIDYNRPPASPAATADMDESTVMAKRLAHMDSQIKALQERNRLLQVEAAIHQQKNTYPSLPLALTAAFVLAVLGLAWWLRKRFLSRQVGAEPAWFAEPVTVNTVADTGLKQAALNMEEINMPAVLDSVLPPLKKTLPDADDDAGWDFSESGTKADGK